MRSLLRGDFSAFQVLKVLQCTVSGHFPYPNNAALACRAVQHPTRLNSQERAKMSFTAVRRLVVAHKAPDRRKRANLSGLYMALREHRHAINNRNVCYWLQRQRRRKRSARSSVVVLPLQWATLTARVGQMTVTSAMTNYSFVDPEILCSRAVI